MHKNLVLPLLVLYMICFSISAKPLQDIIYTHRLNTIKKSYFLNDNLHCVSWERNLKTPLTVLLFIYPDCPLSVHYTYELQQLQKKFNTDVNWLLIIPNDLYTYTEIMEFKHKNNYQLTILFDFNKLLTNFYNIKIAPTAILLDTAFQVKYYGKIDDYAISLSKHKTKPTQFYLQDAIIALLKNKRNNTLPITFTPKTIPIGCIIE